ncbi:MAG: hypothetical protein MK226_11185 [Saprospiraceae bacterium]|nr:hypothetical protein [Saprospiraceae bacterium]
MKFLSNSLLLVIFLLSACQSAEKQDELTQDAQLGNIDISFSSGISEAKKSLEKGMLLLHSFEYDDARTVFRKTQEINSEIPMAVWGEAMTFNHPLWRRQYRDSAQLILTKLGLTKEERIAKGKNPIEKRFLEAAEVLFSDKEKKERDQEFKDFMQQFHEDYPDNHEVSAFYALSLLGSVAVERDEAVFHQSAEIVQSIINNNSQHPGALHYLIHAYDDPVNAPKALKAANNYAKVAPDAAHALHMPSHIYVALGMWEDVVSSNEASYAASVNRMKKLDLDHDARSFHALHWLMYAYLQQGRLMEAKQLMHDMIFFAEKSNSDRSIAYFISMKATYLVETGLWNTSIADTEIDLDNINISKKALYRFCDGMKAYHKKDFTTLRTTILQMESERQEVTTLMAEEGVPMCNANGPYAKGANKLDISQAHILEMELRALYAHTQEKPAVAENWFKEAIKLEKNTTYSYGPPAIAQPSFELYANWLLEQERYDEANEQFEKSLARGPKRLQALRGQLAAAKAIKNAKAIDQIKSTIASILKDKEQLSTL